MPAAVPNVGVRVFSDLSNTIVTIDTRDQSAIGLCVPAPAADAGTFPVNTPVLIDTSDADLIALLGEGDAADVIEQINSEGIVAQVIYVNPGVDAEATLDEAVTAIAGDSATKTGIFALLNAKALLGVEPGILLASGYTHTRPTNAKNPIGAAMEAICTQIIDCIGIVDAPPETEAGAVAYLADFATSLQICCAVVAIKASIGGETVVRPMSPHWAGAIVRRDRSAGTPFKAAWNTALKGVLGTSRPIIYRDGDPTCEANRLVQAGGGVVIETNLLWAPFTTATDPTVKSWRSLKVVRTRRALEKAMVRPMRAYMAQDITPHTVTLIFRAIDDYFDGVQALGAIIDHVVLWDSSLNTAAALQAGAISAKVNWQETPDLVDLGIYTGAMPEAFDVLQAAIAAALASLGDPNIRVAA
ncbi:major tail sheath protein [Hartmannibacter diazotrophicus]|uniref:Major tail sheath protein n=1 Tax=Hartmannibacter diazotrophicus TaxID=1482074 RepID=A0A2C9D6Q4_9HYPH|nr:phage tail protein [Hartmannibacter diazotrophicus]SON55828.1 major tail sheath protein [Hartmannibacter diazotrophicus]